jgi:hypothetical protein
MEDGGPEFFSHHARLIGRQAGDQEALFAGKDCGGDFDNLRACLASGVNDLRKTLAQRPVRIHPGKTEVRHRRRLKGMERRGQGYFARAKTLQESDGIGGRHTRTKIHEVSASSRANLAQQKRRRGFKSFDTALCP